MKHKVSEATESKLPLDRRSFLKAGAAAALVPRLVHVSASLDSDLPSIPPLSGLASVRIVHPFRDLYNTPAAQNEWGYVKATKSVSGINSISLPPFACCGVPSMPWSPGPLRSCELFLNGRILMAYPPGEVASTWYPHRIVREVEADGLRFTTETFMPSKQLAVAELITVKNLGGVRRALTLGFDLRAGVTKKDKAWFVSSPGEADNAITWAPDKGCIIFEAQHSRAVSVQGVTPEPRRIRDGRLMEIELSLDPGEAREFHYLNVIAENRDDGLKLYEAGQARFDGLLKENEDVFNRLIRSAFTPGNSDFSGHLPRLITRDESLWKLYYSAFTNLLFARRASPHSAYGTTYLTLGGRTAPTLSFPWDTSLTSLSLALLDPAALRRLIENWFTQDMHQHLATDYLTGQGVGPWYGVNDMAILRCSRNYLAVTGDFQWLDKQIGGKAVLDHLLDHALYWKKLDHYGQGLADYGGIQNLLEVVSTYLHEVAGMNCGNVSGMRFVAELLERRGNSARAVELRAEAKALAGRINRTLYVQRKGWWRAGQPGGKFNEVRHCYDLLSVLDNMFEDLSSEQKSEMSGFFWSELHTRLWMHALSPDDADATWNIRPDHSWLGAYAAWPPTTAKGLYKIDRAGRVSAWVKQLAKAGNQGPYGQAHFVETVFPPVDGGACKCPDEAPYYNDWSCVSGGGFADLVIDSIFGANLTLYNGVQSNPRLDDFDPQARLASLNYQGKSYDVSAAGTRPSSISRSG